eukprot:gene18393-20938_t
MSKRRGKILADDESIERRNWYSNLQRGKLEEVAKEKAFYKDERKREIAQSNYVETVLREKPLRHNTSPWIVSLNEVKNSTATVLCFHGFGQSHGFFKRWHKQLSDTGVQLCGVCLPGRANRSHENAFTSIRDASIAIFLAMKSMDMLTQHPPADSSEDTPASPPSSGKPLILFGHDVGSLIAYEVAKLLQDYHYNHTALIVSGSPSPYQQGQNRFGKKMCFLSDIELLKHMVELGGVPEALLKRTDVLKYFIPLFRRDYYLYDKYTITPPANVLSIPESEIEYATDALRPSSADKSLKYPDDPPAKLVSRGHSFLSEIEQEKEEELEEMIYPVVLYRLHCEIVTIRVEDDPFVDEKEVAEWTHMSNMYDQVTLDSVGAGGHLKCLCEHENRIVEVIKRCCGVLE